MPTGIMSADPGRLKMNAKTMVTAWVWISLATLAWFAMAEDPCWDAGGALSDPLTLLADSEPLEEKRGGGGFLRVPVWKFLKDGADSSDFDRPQFRCSNMSLLLRFSQARHSDLRLRDGRSLLLLLDRCHGSVWTFGPWLLLELPYTSCHMALKVSNGKWFRQMEVSYFDYLQQASMMTVINCEHPALSRCVATPAVSCSSTRVTVKLPLGARLQRFKVLGKDAVLRTLTTTPEAVFVQISTQSDTDSVLEMMYLDSAGEMSTILATCTVKGSKQNRHPRSLGALDVAANYPYSPELSELIEARDKTEIIETETLCNEDNTVIVETQVTHSDSETIKIADGTDKSATPACDGAVKQDDLPCCEPLDDLPCCEPLDDLPCCEPLEDLPCCEPLEDLPCCNPSEEDLTCSDHEHEDPPSSQPPTGVHDGPFPGFSSSQYSLHSQSISSSNQATSNDSQYEGRPSKGHSEAHQNGSHPLSDHSHSISSRIPFAGGSGKPSSGGPPFLSGQPTSHYRPSHYGGHPAKGHGEGHHPKGHIDSHHKDLSSKGGKGSGEGHPLGSQPSSDQSLSLSLHTTFTSGPPLSVNQSTSGHGSHPSKVNKGSGEWPHDGRPSKERDGHPNGSHPLSDHSHIAFTGSGGKTVTGGPPFLGGQNTSYHGGHPSKGGKGSGEGRPFKEHDEGFHKGHPSKERVGSRPGASSQGHPSKGHVEGLGEGHHSKSGKGSAEGRPAKGHEGRREGQPSKDGKGKHPGGSGETSLPGSQHSSVQSQSLSSRVSVTGSNSSTSSGGQPTSDHRGHPSKGGNGSGEVRPAIGSKGSGQGHHSKGGQTSLPGSQPSSIQSQSLSSGVSVTGSNSSTSSGGKPTSDNRDHPSKGGEGSGETSLNGIQHSSVQSQTLSSHVLVTGGGSKTLSGSRPFLGGKPTSDHGGHPSKVHDEGHGEGNNSKGGKGSAEGRPSKGHDEGQPSKNGKGRHPGGSGETHLPGSHPSSESQSLSSHVPVTGSSSKTSLGGQPSKAGKGSGDVIPSIGSEGGGQTSLPGSQPSSVQSQSLSSRISVTGSNSSASSGGKPTSDHGGHPSKVRGEGHHSKGGKGSAESRPSKGHDEDQPFKDGKGRHHEGSSETHLPGSQPSSVQSQSLSSRISVTGSNSSTSSGRKPTSDHGGHPSKGGEVSRPQGSGETSLPSSQHSSVHQSQSLSSHVLVTGGGSKTLSGGRPFLGGKPTSDHGGHPSKVHDEGHGEGNNSKGGKGSAEGRPSKGHDEGQPSKNGKGRHPGGSGETHLPGSHPSFVESQSLSSHVPVIGSSRKTSLGGQPSKGGNGSGDVIPSIGSEGGGQTSRPGSQPSSVQSQSLSSRISVTGSNSSASSDGKPTSDHGGHPSKGGEVSRPQGSGETSLPGSQPSSVQSQSLSSHISVTGSNSSASSDGKPTSDHGGHPSKMRGEGHHAKGGKGSAESRPSKGHDEDQPFKDGKGRHEGSSETHLPGSQHSSGHQSQSLSSHVLVTGGGSKTLSGGRPFLGGKPTSYHGGHPSKVHDEGHHPKGGKGNAEGHPSRQHSEGQPSKNGKGRHPGDGSETHLPGSHSSSVQFQSLSSHVPVTGSNSSTSSGGKPTSDHGGHPSKVRVEGHHSKGGKGSAESRPSKGHDEDQPSKHGKGRHPEGSSETHLPGSQPSSLHSQSLSSHVPVTGSSSKTSSGGQPTSDHKGHPSKAGKGSGEVRPSKGGQVNRPEVSGEGRPSKGGQTSLPGSKLSSVQSQSLSSHVPITGSGSKSSSGGQTSDHGRRPSKGHNGGHREGHHSKGGEGRLSKGYDRG